VAQVGEGFQEAPARSGPSDARGDARGRDRTGGCAVGPGFDGGGVDWSYMEGRRRSSSGGHREEREGRRKGKTACRPKMLGAPALRTHCKKIVGFLLDHSASGKWLFAQHFWLHNHRLACKFCRAFVG
jgi:hypothetical protein